MSTGGVASHSTAVDTADYHPDKDPPGAEQTDDKMEDVVSTVSFNIGGADLKRETESRAAMIVKVSCRGMG